MKYDTESPNTLESINNSFCQNFFKKLNIKYNIEKDYFYTGNSNTTGFIENISFQDLMIKIELNYKK